jgi:hypothetical protein
MVFLIIETTQQGTATVPKKTIDQETARQAIDAVLDLMDGVKEHDIQAATGLPDERCKEIYALYCRLFKEFTHFG